MSCISEAAENPYGEDDNKSPFPVQPQVKRSYAQNVTVWIKASGLQVDENNGTKVNLFDQVTEETLNWSQLVGVIFVKMLS